MLVRYNNHLPLKRELIEEIEDYFDFYWANDRLSFISYDVGVGLLAEVPVDVRLLILKQFLFQDFYAEFSRHFELQRPVDAPKVRYAFYKWGDEVYDEFMLEIMKALLPRRYFEGDIIFEELQEVLEMTFVQRGKFHVGYEINKKRKFVVSLAEGRVIGEYNVLFMQPSMHIYKCTQEIFGYALSRRSWMDISAEFEEFADELK